MRYIMNGCLVLLLTSAISCAQAAVKVFTCEPEWAALVMELGGAQVDVYAATNGLQDPHRVEARPSLIAKLRNADLLVCTGGGLEAGWLPVLLRQSGNAHVQPGTPGYFEAASHVTMLEVPATVDRAMGDVHPEGNPHIHVDPRRIARVAEALAGQLAEIDRDHASLYRQRYADFSSRWQAAMVRWEKIAAPLRGAAIIAHHKDWVYFADWLGLREVAMLEPLPGLPPTVLHLAELKDRYKAGDVLAIIRTPYQDAKGSEWLNRQTGIPAVVLPYSVGGTPAATDLFALFDESLRMLLELKR